LRYGKDDTAGHRRSFKVRSKTADEREGTREMSGKVGEGVAVLSRFSSKNVMIGVGVALSGRAGGR